MNLLKGIFNFRFLIHTIIALSLVAGLVFGLKYYLNFFTHHDKTIEIPEISKLDLFDAMVALDNAGLKYEIDSFKFDPKFKPYQIFDVYPKEGSYVKEGRRIFLRANPKTYAPVVVPNLVDKYKKLAYTLLEIAKLQVGDTLYEPHPFKDVVLRMMYKGKKIEAGVSVPRFSKIDLVIGKELEKDVVVPNFVGLSLGEAKRQLKYFYFDLGRVQYFNNEKDSLQAIIYYQNPPANTIYDQGQSIDFWLSKENSDSLSSEIKRLDNIYNKKIQTDSTGKLNFQIQEKISGNVSKEVKTIINNSSTSSAPTPDKPKPVTKKPAAKKNTNDGIIIE